VKNYFPTFRRLFGLDPPLASGGLRRFSFASFWPQYTTAAQRRGVLRLIAVAAEENVPLTPLLGAWAESERGVQVHRLRRLVRLLDKGLPLPDAVEQVRGLVSEDDALAVRVGSQAGTLASTLRTHLANNDQRFFLANVKLRQAFWYFLLVLFIGVNIVAFLQVKIMPEFEKIMTEFGMEPNAFFTASVTLADFVSRYWYFFAFALFLMLGLFFSRKPGRFVRTHIFNPLFKPLRDIRSANMLSHLAGTLAAGRPALGAVSTLARYHYDSVARQQMLVARNDVEQGANLWSSLARNKVLSPADAAALGTCKPLGNEAWMLGHLASLKRSRAAAWSERVAGWLLPLVVLALGSFVLLQALAVFGTLNHLIWGLR
jgi:type II secretory pathway component PulF